MMLFTPPEVRRIANVASVALNATSGTTDEVVELGGTPCQGEAIEAAVFHLLLAQHCAQEARTSLEERFGPALADRLFKAIEEGLAPKAPQIEETVS